MSRQPFRLSPDERPFLEIASLGRSGPPGTTRLSPAQIEQIRRTVRRTPEVMVKVTGGGTNPGTVAAHFAYISRRGKLEIETDEGERITGTDAQRTFLAAWHLELSAGQYRGARDQRTDARARAKLIETRKAVIANWMKIADTLDRQGEVILAGDVRYFAKHLPPALTDTERLAAKFTEHLASFEKGLSQRGVQNRDTFTR